MLSLVFGVAAPRGRLGLGLDADVRGRGVGERLELGHGCARAFRGPAPASCCSTAWWSWSVRSATVAVAKAFASSAAASGESSVAVTETKLLWAIGSAVILSSSTSALVGGAELLLHALGDVHVADQERGGLDVARRVDGLADQRQRR